MLWATLRRQLDELIKSTGWAPDKQSAWLEKQHGLKNWDDARPVVLKDAIAYLERFDKMFSGDLDSVSPRHNTGKSAEERESLRIYLGEGEEE